MTKTVDDLLAEFDKKHSLKVGSMASVVSKVEPLTTGNLAIDWMTGIGGLPQGKVTELYGLPSSGKTTTALQTAVQLQRKIIESGSDDRILYLDFEKALDADYAEDLGLDLDHPSLLITQPHWLEQGAEAALQLIDTGKVRLTIWDSVAAMASKRLIEGGFDQATAAMHRAKLMSGLLQTLVSLLDQKRCAGLFINHLMESVEMSGRPGLPPKATTPGGRALKYYSSVRLEFKQGKNITSKLEDVFTGEDTNQAVATQVYVKAVKNKVGPPFRTVELRSRFGMGFDNAWSALQVLTTRRLIQPGATGYFYFDKSPQLIHEDMDVSGTGRPYVQGESKLLAFADEHPQWRDLLISTAVEALEAAE